MEGAFDAGRLAAGAGRGMQEDEHLYHTTSLGREPWIGSLGMPCCRRRRKSMSEDGDWRGADEEGAKRIAVGRSESS